jgi:hypothetical protein
MPRNSVASGCTKSSTSKTVFNATRPEFPAKLDPSTPLFKIKELADVFFNHWLPRREQFAQKPQSDRKVRVNKGKTLNEGVTKVILKMDQVEVNGDNKVREERKRVVRIADDVETKIKETIQG